jgi:disease resistance protein RPS2
MQILPSGPVTAPLMKSSINRLRWSYNDLPDRNLKICFLYCAVFPEDAEINVETLVEMWSAEKLVTLMDAGHEYIDVLVDRGLFEYVGAE